ncbi:MAG TPA: class I SAM-dependent methyltransferase [Terriglobales bacterium]
MRRVKNLVLRPDAVYRLYLKLKFGSGRLAVSPEAATTNGALKTSGEWQQAVDNAKRLRLPLHRLAEKNWDHIAAISILLAHTNPSACILDAGAEYYSNVLPALFLYGYRKLYGMNLGFVDPASRGPIRYLPGDITCTGFPDDHFDAVTCMSVIEHGVSTKNYLKEMHRVLKPDGLLITSTDYYPTPIDTGGQVAHGCPIKIFSREEIEAILTQAEEIGLQSTGDVDLECSETPILWAPYGLEYTFLLFTLQKKT